ncbi:hypothetical protein GOODEAATRI_018564 [Goodea atripinnis]|uniref:Uncharacterized protein n=1 Tax=Goodea atripinnis TaxID=208336 RepID=A0ABV0PPQ3_9TELE
MNNWIKLFFHTRVGVQEEGRKTQRRWEASVWIIGGYWPPVLTESMKCGYYPDSCQCFFHCATYSLKLNQVFTVKTQGHKRIAGSSGYIPAKLSPDSICMPTSISLLQHKYCSFC